MIIGNKEFDLENECYIMGILNVTPDSFSDGGKWNTIDGALRHAEDMIGEGCDIIDIGGESTRPGHVRITDEEEIERVTPVIEAVKRNFDIPVSLDTYKSRVAKAGIDAGADLINDIWGCRYEELCQTDEDAVQSNADMADSTMAKVIADAAVPCVLMHNRSCTDYEDYLKEVADDLGKCAAAAMDAGVRRDKIILDPGIGFGKTFEQNLILMNNLDIMERCGFPWLLGTSRKSMIGLALDLPADERVEGTLVTTVFGVLKGCSIIRVHDIKENCRAIKMTKAICSEKR